MGLGVNKRRSSSSVLARLIPEENGTGEGKGEDGVGGPPMGRKLRRFVTRLVGESGEGLGDEGATESKLGDGARKGIGDDGDISFISTSLVIGETDISGVAPGISMPIPREPVDESRTSISAIGFVRDASEGVDLELVVVDSVREAMPGFAWVVDGLCVGISGLSLPIDIFFKKPHFPGCCSFGLSSFLREPLRWRVVGFSASYIGAL